MEQARQLPARRFILHPLSFRIFSSACTLLTAFCLLPSELHGQGCAMCYTSASAAQSAAKQALANGTLILLVPPLLFFALITVVLYRYRNRYRESLPVTGPSTLSESHGIQDSSPQTEIPRNAAAEIAAELRYLDEGAVVMVNDKEPGIRDERLPN